MSLWNKIKYLNLNIFRTRGCKPLIFQAQIIWSKKIHSLKYLRSATFGSKDIVIRKSKFVAKTQFLSIHKLASLSHKSSLKKFFFDLKWIRRTWSFLLKMDYFQLKIFRRKKITFQITLRIYKGFNGTFENQTCQSINKR